LFQETLDFVTDTDLTFLHVFPYSERPGTPAARMPSVATPVRRERAGRLREAGARAARRFLDGQLGREISLVVETEMSGHSEHFAPVRLTAPSVPGALLAARVISAADDFLLAEPI
jgi:threonylcarbamoyladenosine tRNA methylthiotransferase MtaB